MIVPAYTARTGIMNGYSFETFDAHSANRAAFEACRAVARRAYSGNRPLILLGEAGTGKSHLLWSIVREIRAARQRIGLGLILSTEFPDSVRNLVVNPNPVRRDRPSILLVDELERFQDNAPDLEAVVKVFLDNGHDIVFATRVRPEALDFLSPGLRAVLADGNTIAVQSQTAAPFADAGASGDEIARLMNELETFRIERESWLESAAQREQAWETEKTAVIAERDGAAAALETIQGRLLAAEQALEERRERLEAGEAAELALRTELEAARVRFDEQTGTLNSVRAGLLEAEQDRERLRGELAETERGFTAARTGMASLEQSLEAAQEALAASRTQCDAARDEATALAEERDALAKQSEERSAEIQSLHERLAAVEARCAVLEPRANALEDMEARYASLKDQYVAANAAIAEKDRLLEDADAQRAAAEDLSRRMTALTRRVEERLAAAPETLRDETVRLAARLGAMETAATVFGKEDLVAELASVRVRAEAVYTQWQQDRRRFERELDAARNECRHLSEIAETSCAEKGRMQVALDSALGRSGALEFELERARKALALREAEMDALRQEAATQVASAAIQAGEMEHRLVSLEAALARLTHHGISSGDEEAARISEELALAAEAFRALAARQAALAGSPETAPLEEDENQCWLFEGEERQRRPNPLPGSGDTLRQMVERALADPEEL